MAGGLPSKPTESFRRRNPHLYPGDVWTGKIPSGIKRVRQGERKPNKLEAEFASIKRLELGGEAHVMEQAVRLRLANGAWYKPDVVVMAPYHAICAYEVKGGRGMKGQSRGMLALKMAASNFPRIMFVLVWKEQGVWKQQIINF